MHDRIKGIAQQLMEYSGLEQTGAS